MCVCVASKIVVFFLSFFRLQWLLKRIRPESEEEEERCEPIGKAMNDSIHFLAAAGAEAEAGAGAGAEAEAGVVIELALLTTLFLWRGNVA